MNGRTAKKLRAVARGKSVRLVSAEYREEKHEVMKWITTPQGETVQRPFTMTTIRLVDNCTRKLYQKLKRVYKMAQKA